MVDCVTLGIGGDKCRCPLHDPNPNSPANAEAAQLYRENMKEYVRRVKATVEESWLDPEEREMMEQEDAAEEAEAEAEVEEAHS